MQNILLAGRVWGFGDGHICAVMVSSEGSPDLNTLTPKDGTLFWIYCC